MWSRSVRVTCASSRGSTSSTTTASATIKDSTTGFCSTRPRPKHGATHVQRRDRLGGLLNFYSLERPRDRSAH